MMLSDDSRGQGATEYLLLLGGVLVIAIMALFIYANYFGNPLSSNSTITLVMTNNGPEIDSSLRYEVYDKDGNLLVASRVLSGTSNGTFKIGTYPKGSTLKLHETLNGYRLTSTINTNIAITAYSGPKIIIDAPIMETVSPNQYKGARGNWYSGQIS
jgi:hypothetical protein